MNTVLLVICISIGILICILTGAILYFLVPKKRKSIEIPAEKSAVVSKPVIVENNLPVEEIPEQLSIPVEEISALTEVEEKQLYEIKDSEIKQRVLQIVPEAMRIIGNAGVAAMATSAGPLYQAIIPAGTTLAKSRNIAGASRGFVMKQGRIVDHADFLESAAGKQIAAIGTVNAIVGVASVVVGQYYMSCINKELEGINTQIHEISQFLDDEYRSKVIVLGMEIQQISNFQLEIFDKPEVRNRELDHLRRLGYECAQLLEQANLSLSRVSASKIGPKDYETYSRLVSEAGKWCEYQEILLKLLCKISEMIYALYQGDVSVNYSYSVFEPHYKQATLVSANLDEWEEKSAKICGVDYEKGRRRRGGIWSFFGFIYDDLNYKKIEAKTLNDRNRIKENPNEIVRTDLYSQDVRIIVQGNKLYYLPMKEIQDALGK